MAEYSLKPDWWIANQAREGEIITPFVGESVSEGRKISYGLSPYGYDIRLSEKDFRIFRHIPGEVVDPKRANPKSLEQAELFSDDTGAYFILPGNSYALGVAVERLTVPSNILVMCIGKSTYARIGVIVNVTPAEPGWEGHLTLEFSNSSNTDVRIYANEGIAQLIFLEGEQCQTTYNQRKGGGKYQNQLEEVVLSKVMK